MPTSRPRQRRRRSRVFKVAIAVVVTGAVAGLAYLNLKKEKPAETFATVLVTRGKLVDKLAETGAIELVRTVEVKSTIAGEVRQLLVEAGEWVREGQLLAVIEPDPNQSLQLYQKRWAVERDRINLDEQERDFARKEALHAGRMLPEKEFEEAQTQLTRARNSLRLAELELEILETKANLNTAGGQTPSAQLDEIRVVAPIDGIVIRREVEIGEVVASGLSAFSGGTLLFEIGDPSQMIVRGDIAEVDVAQLEAGQEVEIVVDAYPDTTYPGRVRWIAPVGQKRQGSPIVTFDTEIDIVRQEPKLRQGMSCDIDIIFARRDSALSLPLEAVLEVFDGQEASEEEVKGRRGRFVAYAVQTEPVDSVGTDSLPAGDTLAAAGGEPAPVAQDNPPGTPPEVRGDAASTGTDTAGARATTTADTTAAGGPKEPPKATLEELVEVMVEVGLETSTRVEVLSGLHQGQRVAADPALIRRQKEEQAKPPADERKGWF